MLLGDHAVVYYRPCLVASVDTNIAVSVALAADDVLITNAPDLGLINYSKKIDHLCVGEVR